MAPSITIDPALLDRRLTELARHGAYGETGVWRTVYSPEWVAATDLFASWCEEAGLRVRRDAVGNVWGRLDGSDGGPAVVSGSHVDSQRPGGRFDGALGIVGALAAIRTLRDRFGQPRRPIEVVAFCEEEASRFPGANCWGSRAVTGAIAPDEPDRTRGYGPETIGEAMRVVGLDPAGIPAARREDVAVFLELHVEQGPVLEQAGLAAGIVDAITGIRHYVVEVEGEANHAGAFPMDLRRDPMAAAAEMIDGVIGTAHRMGRPAVTTVGRIAAEPGGPAIVPAKVTFTVDARHPDPARRDLLYRRHEALMTEVATRRDVRVTWGVPIDQAPQPCDPELVRLLEEAAREQGITTLTMTSGAVHDALIMARTTKVGMIFVRSEAGRSHTPDEFSTTADCAAGAAILAAALRRLAY